LELSKLTPIVDEAEYIGIGFEEAIGEGELGLELWLGLGSWWRVRVRVRELETAL